MNTFQTSAPITAVIELSVGDIKVNASDRADCTVSIRPRDEHRQADVRAAESAHVEYLNGALDVKSVKTWLRLVGPSKNDGAVVVEVNLPTDSSVIATTGMGLVHFEGELADTDVTAGMGDIRLDHVRALKARTGLGDVTVDDVAADAKVSTSSGSLRLGNIAGAATIKNSNGNVDIGQCGRYAHVRASFGNVTIGRALSSCSVVTAVGDIRIFEVSAGSVTIRTGTGAVTIGVRDGAAAWLELAAKYGSVRNGLTAAPGPEAADSTVEVRARTSGGDITVNRATAA